MGERAEIGRILRIARGEMLEIVAPRGPLARGALTAAFGVPAASLARTLVALDRHLERGTLCDAALATLARYGVAVRIDGPVPPQRGALLVVSNHPGLFDALALFAAIRREDLGVVAAKRPLFDALPNLRRRLVTIDAGASGGFAVRAALRHLRAGGAILHFPAGQIEPDPRIVQRGAAALGSWRPGLDLLARASLRACAEASVVPVAVAGVVSRRARAAAAAIAGRGGPTDALVPLIQLTLPGFRDVDVSVRFGTPIPIAEVARQGPEPLRQRLAALAEIARTELRARPGFSPRSCLPYEPHG